MSADWQHIDDVEALAAADKLFAGECNFVTSVAKADQVPYTDLPEVAFVGRSNVGKSSLINALSNQNKLAKASNTPGRTRLLNFFNLADTLMMVDLPGYGYAKAPKTDIAQWQELTLDYLRGRPQLQRIMILIDGRHGIKPGDREMMDLLDKTANSYQLVLTKLDKCKRADMLRVWQETTQETPTHAACHPQVLVTSSEKKDGISELRAFLHALAQG